MNQSEIQRKLAAILAADVVGYSRLMAGDEQGTLDTLKRHRAECLDPSIDQHHGRVVKTTGDGLLLEFPSVVEAVKCAMEMQRGMAERNADVAEDARMLFRMGINVGDVIVDGDDIYGDGVNVAARLEGLAPEGGICISRSARDQVRDKMDVKLEDLGELEVKNIPRPVRVFRVELEGAPTAAAPARAAAPAAADKPSIAVLPFDNMSGDPEQEFFVDGITEDIITELSRFPTLFVIARNSTFTYKGSAVRVPDVARELGVRYVVEGSVRRAGNRIRITVQLIEGESGNHIWVERYDRELVDVFDLQDEITQAIVAVLPGRVEAADAELLKRKTPEVMAAYDFVLQGKILHHRGTKEDNVKALSALETAIEMDPSFAQAHAWKACTIGQAMARGYTDEDPKAMFARAEAAARHALELDETNLECNRIMCEVNMIHRRWDQAELFHAKAISLNPNDPRLVAQRGELKTWLGDPDEGAEAVEMAMRLDPFDADSRAHLLGRARYAQERFAEAVAAYKRVSQPRAAHLADLAACQAKAGDEASAQANAAQVLELNPEFTISGYAESLRYKETRDLERHLDGLRAAGLPD